MEAIRQIVRVSKETLKRFQKTLKQIDFITKNFDYFFSGDLPKLWH